MKRSKPGGWNHDAEVRHEAAHSLQVLGDQGKEAVPALERRLNDSNKGVRDRAVEALVAIEPERFQHLKAEQKIEENSGNLTSKVKVR